jgi:hypothetical protein
MFLRFVFALTVTTIMAFAQPPDMSGGGMGRGSGGGMSGGRGGDMGATLRTQRESPFDIFADKLKLNKDQKTESFTILQDAAKEMAPIQQQLQQARQDLAGAFISGAANDRVDQLLKSYAPLASQSAAIEARAFAKICKMLKPNQEKNAGQAFELLAETLDRPRSSGGRGGNRSER